MPLGKPPTHGLKIKTTTAHILWWKLYLVIQEGFEPPTHGLERRCSIQLSYTPSTQYIIAYTQMIVKHNALKLCLEKP